jgi:hypothetical protein
LRKLDDSAQEGDGEEEALGYEEEESEEPTIEEDEWEMVEAETEHQYCLVAAGEHHTILKTGALYAVSFD